MGDKKENENSGNAYSEEFQSKLNQLTEVNSNAEFAGFIQKEEISFVIFVDSIVKGKDDGIQKFVTTTNDGFIKMNEFNVAKNTFQTKKSFFVCQSGISVAC